MAIDRRRIRARRNRRRRGQTLVEYALIVSIISIVAVGVLITLGQQTHAIYTMINSQIARSSTGS
jgi:Flp pilus assembly pilin Flp